VAAVTRRSREVQRLGRFLRIGQEWRRRADRSVWTVRQIHRADGEVRLVNAHGDRTTASIEDLRTGWLWIARRREARSPRSASRPRWRACGTCGALHPDDYCPVCEEVA
jgi:hypothetical protein